jgi:uncharacterized membrane protein
MLFPVAVLIVIVLAAIAVDSAIVFLGQREVTDAVAAAANDAATLGVGNRAFYQGGAVVLDQSTVERMASERVRASLDPGRFHDVRVDVTVMAPTRPACPPSVRVRASATVAYLFARAVPGGTARTTVEATATAAPEQQGDPAC